MKLKILSTFCLLPYFLLAQTNISDFDWLIGNWKLQTEKYDSYEEWVKETESAISGTSYIMDGDQKKISERLLIQKIHDHVAYIAMPGKSNPTLFTLISIDKGQYVFENPEHDFPQRIIYEQTGQDSMNVTIEGNDRGKKKRIVFSFTRSN